MVCIWVFSESSIVEVFAQDSNTPADTTPWKDESTKTETSIAQWLEFIIRALYLVMRPLLAIAWAAMDNSLVYGGIFNFEPVLWRFWNLMRSFANFGVWFLFLYEIFKTIFGFGGGVSELAWVIKKTVLAAIVINISWFLMAQLINLSTVATVTVGWLPLYILTADATAPGSDDAANAANTFNDIRYLKPYAMFKMDATPNQLKTESDHSLFYGCPESWLAKQYYIPCLILDNKLAPNNYVQTSNTWWSWKGWFVDSRKNIDLNTVGSAPWASMPGWSKNLTADSISDVFCVYQWWLIKNEYDAVLSSSKLKELIELGKKEMNDAKCRTIDQLISKAARMTWPLFTLYSSLLNGSEMAITLNNKTIAWLSMDFLMKAIMAIALIIPLFTLAIVLIVRVGYLWIIIVGSPIIALLLAFDKDGAVWWGDIIKNILSRKNILNLVFLPVVATFAVSISVVFLSLIQKAPKLRDVWIQQLFELKGTCPDKPPINSKCYDLGITKLYINEAQSNAGNNIVDTFGYLVVNGFGIVLMRVVVFAALKSSAITEKIADATQWFWQQLLSAVPLVPTGSWRLNYNDIEQVKKQWLELPWNIIRSQTWKAQDIIWWVTNRAEIVNTNTKLWQQQLVPWTPNTDAQAIITSWATAWTDHTAYSNFFPALSSGAWAAKPYQDFSQAFADPAIYKQYGMKGMQNILTKRNKSNDSGTRKAYSQKYGSQMATALDTLAKDSSSGVKAIPSKSGKMIYIDTKNNEYMSINGAPDSEDYFNEPRKYTPEQQSWWFTSSDAAQWYVDLVTSFDSLQKLKEIFPATTWVLNTNINATYKLATNYKVNVVGANGEATSVTKSADQN
jgi:hypothetical protein